MDQTQYERAFGMLKKAKESERRIHKRVTAYLRHNYPDIRFHTSLDGEAMGTYQREHVGYLQWGSGFPDLMIFKGNDQHVGLALEIKKDGESPYKRDGTRKAGKHLREQESWLKYLRANGWRAEFGVGYSQCIDIILEHFEHGKIKKHGPKISSEEEGEVTIRFEDD
jgi:hypothetical protein